MTDTLQKLPLGNEGRPRPSPPGSASREGKVFCTTVSCWPLHYDCKLQYSMQECL